MQDHPHAIRLIQISDPHCYADDDALLEWSILPVKPNLALDRLLQHLGSEVAHDALIISGDLVQEETAASYQRLNQRLIHYPKPVHVLPGNHDVPSLMQTHLSDSCHTLHWPHTVKMGNWELILLNSHQYRHPAGYLSDNALQTLKQQITAMTDGRYGIVFLHHHPIDIGSPWMDRMGLLNRQEFWQLIDGSDKIKAVVFGHIHDEFTGTHTTQAGQNITVLGTPSTCVQLKHDKAELDYQHTRPAWREILLYDNGEVASCVHYMKSTSLD